MVIESDAGYRVVVLLKSQRQDEEKYLRGNSSGDMIALKVALS
jgi:hypothetical protein